MNRIAIIGFLGFSLFLQASNNDQDNIVPCFENSPGYVQRMLGTWERIKISSPTNDDHGIPWGAQFKKISFKSEERVIDEFRDIITSKRYCAYLAGTMETVDNDGNFSSHPFVLLEVDNVPTVFWISSIKEDYKHLSAMATELRLHFRYENDQLLLGGEFGEDPKSIFERIID